jgi:hypothetical protein
MESVFWSILLRMGQITIEASSTWMVGLLVAAILRRMVGAAGTRRLFGGTGWGGLFRAWVIGSLLPVCSFGVIPVVRELRRAGVPTATVLSFLLAAPQLNPLSFLYGLTLSDPIVIVCFVLGTMSIAILGGELWQRFCSQPGDDLPPGDEPAPTKGLKRLAAVLVTAARELFSPATFYIGVGILVTGLVAGLLPFGCLSLTMRHDDLSAPLLMAALSVVLFSGVLPGMMRIGLMFDHGNSVGAAFVLFELGVGLNAGLVLWLVQAFGWRRALAWLASVIALTLGLAYAAEYPLYFPHEQASHTHAFDEWTSPFFVGDSVALEQVGKKLVQKIEVLEPLALLVLVGLVPVGLLVRRWDRQGWLEDWLTRAPAPTQSTGVLHRDVPAPVLGLVALAALVAFSLVGLYIYYPPAKETFEQMNRVKAEALIAVQLGKKEEAIRQIQHLDLLTRKLQVGVFLRTGTLPHEAGAAAEELRQRLEEVRDALIANELAEAKKGVPPINKAYQTCRAAFMAKP